MVDDRVASKFFMENLGEKGSPSSGSDPGVGGSVSNPTDDDVDSRVAQCPSGLSGGRFSVDTEVVEGGLWVRLG